jgi:CDP-4-dehydro-6-deoxyglucose reductase, E1
LTDELIQLCNENNILLIEDVCESHGTTFKGQKVGTYGFASNFSFYFAHHMSTIEGGMICTNDEKFYQVCRALRSHGMMREMTNNEMKQEIIDANPDLNPDFIFIRPAHNFRSTELNAVIGLSQIKKLDSNNLHRVDNFKYFMERLDSTKYHTDIEMDGQCNYAFIVVLKDGDFEFRNKVESTLRENGIEFRRGLSGGGNQLRQPWFKKHYNIDHSQFPNMDHVHHFGWYVGNYPSLEREKIDTLINVLNGL